jgi:hypothetical protein
MTTASDDAEDIANEIVPNGTVNCSFDSSVADSV